jgi:hypothetical protein
MPFKSITAPRRVTDLGAEVRSAAVLATPSLVAFLTTDPVRLSVHPTSGTAKVTNVALDGAQEVAFLNRDIAVVRAEDDAVWALLDVTHTPKMDQVARDIRFLCARPSGETAFALGWDGTATAFTVQGHEVVARQFAVRGSVRAADLTATEAFVVVDVGSPGGELRVHPGATPEPGATGRASLPDGAAGLDRVRGGASLSALFKRGSGVACVVPQKAGRLSAKMIDLGSPIADLAVAETSLVAAFTDGRLALYDGEAIARAGDGPAEPTSITPLGARGEPRALAVSGKQSPLLWIGSSEGSVMQATLPRKQVISLG